MSRCTIQSTHRLRHCSDKSYARKITKELQTTVMAV